MNWRFLFVAALIVSAGCSLQEPQEDYWIQWCAAEFDQENGNEDIELNRLRASFVLACNYSLAAQMRLEWVDFQELHPPCGFSLEGDTLVWKAFFSDPKLNNTLSPDFRNMGADSSKAISNYEACFYRTIDMCFEAMKLIRQEDTITLTLPFGLR